MGHKELIRAVFSDQEIADRYAFTEDSLVEDVRLMMAPFKEKPKGRMADILFRRFGLAGYEPHTLKAAGEAWGITGARVRDLESKALRIIKHPSRSRPIRDGVPYKVALAIREEIAKAEDERKAALPIEEQEVSWFFRNETLSQPLSKLIRQCKDCCTSMAGFLSVEPSAYLDVINRQALDELRELLAAKGLFFKGDDDYIRLELAAIDKKMNALKKRKKALLAHDRNKPTA